MLDLKDFDYMIVGAGIAGITVANKLAVNDEDCRIALYDSAESIGGTSKTHKYKDINVHTYGPHIFHTSDKEVWDTLNLYCRMLPYINSPIANYNGEVYNLPFNMNTFVQILNCDPSPRSVMSSIESEIEKYASSHPDFDRESPRNLEEKAISMVGTTIYEKLVRWYTQKQWNADCKDLPPEIISRLPLRFTFDNNYYTDYYQGIPDCGYSELFRRMVNYLNIEVFTSREITLEDITSALSSNPYLKIVYTGQLDKLFDYKYGKLPFRSLRFETIPIPENNHQGVAVMNYTGPNIKDQPYTRVTEHRHFDRNLRDVELGYTVLTYEFPDSENDIPYYPIRSDELYNKYLDELNSLSENRIYVTGRCGNWKYQDMDLVMSDSINLVYCTLL